MGFFSSIQKLFQPSPRALYEHVEIVGESFYKDSFKEIRSELGLGPNSESNLKVELRQDPNNPHSRSGKAVAVFVSGRKVGHISEMHSSIVFDLLDSSGGVNWYEGRVFFGDLREARSKSSVSIRLKVMVSSAEEVTAKEKRYQKSQDKMAREQALMREWLRNPVWSSRRLVPGDSVTLSGFGADSPLAQAVSQFCGAPREGGFHLLVLNSSIIKDSAKLRDRIARGKAATVTDVHTFVANNPEFAKYANHSN